jgi:hypothetical protein
LAARTSMLRRNNTRHYMHFQGVVKWNVPRRILI